VHLSGEDHRNAELGPDVSTVLVHPHRIVADPQAQICPVPGIWRPGRSAGREPGPDSWTKVDPADRRHPHRAT
jgi:hypothetical protein